MLVPTLTRQRHLRLPSGIHLNLIEQGESEGLPVLLLHGWPDSSQSWELLLPLLPSAWRVFAIDQRGHGHSDRPREGYAIDQLAADVEALLDELGLPRSVVVGHSMGSFVARRVAERAPGRVSGLVLIGTAPVARNAALLALAPAVHALRDPVDMAFVREFQESTVARPVPAEFMARAIRQSQRVPARIWQAVFEGLLSFEPGPAPCCPTLVTGGTRDGLFSVAEQEAVSAAIPGARIELVEGVGHALHWEAPEIFATSLLHFVKELG